MKKNIILLTIDALRADHLSCYGYKKNTTPNIDKIAKKNIQFLNAYSTSSHTRESAPSLLTGRYPLESICNDYQLEVDTISTYLKDTPYKTGAFHSNPYISRAYGFDRDFDKFYDDLAFGQNKMIALAQRLLDKIRNKHYAKAKKINKISLNWIDSLNSKQPFFLWNHYMDVHGPYQPPKKYQRKFCQEKTTNREAQRLYKRSINDPESITKEEKQKLVNLYNAEIKYIDNQIKIFLRKLENRNILKNSLLIITSDHGELFGKNGFYGHPRYLYQELIHIPLIILGNNINSCTSKLPVSLIDIVPTILKIANKKESKLPGESLFSILNKNKSRIVFSSSRGEKDNQNIIRFASQSEEWKYILEKKINNKEIVSERLFDKSFNPSTQIEMDDNVPEKAIDLILDLKSYSKSQINKLDNKNGRKNMKKDKEIEDRLKALGYK